ncbi:MerR family transcriptional regulator [Shinella fusca]|jgi:MerR family mercuric resistance operon transcriptional regulator|uniref:Mercuric resistance operon regulatory protein n=1 Tax=Shinella fusca TaxID=544480 RepID=A0A7W8DT94_9HYPH|nr:MerR family DNA-binding protein [Shinella fusca]MBB5041195.1 MerR family mercuric resistance operon transcriptional regulator [Shinella fusca]
MVRSQHLEDLTIGKFAAAADVGVETVRFYQRRGLLSTPRRIDGIRRYGSADVARLRFIRQAQAAGFTLEEIRRLLDLDSGEDRATVREMAAKRLAELDARMEALQQARTSLQTLVSECAVGRTGPCPILKSFEA